MACSRHAGLVGATVATRYCSPQNRAAQLTPEIFASYLDEPGYAPLVTWDEMQTEDEEIEEDTGLAEVAMLVKEEEEESFTLVTWRLSLHDGKWLIDSLNIV